MTAPAASPPIGRRAPWALWTILLAMLLALQASAGAIRPAALAEAGAVAAKLTLPAPLAAQLRESGPALKAAGQRLNAVKLHAGHDGTTPPLPACAVILGPPALTVALHLGLNDNTPCTAAPASAYRARAPPLSA